MALTSPSLTASYQFRRRTPRYRRRGLTAIEFLVIFAIISIVLLFLLMALSRGREEARLLGCRNNLFHIGVALATYDQSYHCLPFIGEPAPAEPFGLDGPRSPGPLRVLLESLQLPDMTELTDPEKTPPARPGQVPGDMPVPGFVCGSDPNATGASFAAPISYRAVTGDTPAGDNGAFAPGRKHSLAEIEAADGLGFTAGFAERLVGDNGQGPGRLNHYQVVPGPLSPPACPASTDPAVWRRDAGSSWRTSDYRSTLYNHALRPNGKPSCITPDGGMAFIGASSGHPRGLNLLRLDGTVTLVRISVDSKVWRELAEIGSVEPITTND